MSQALSRPFWSKTMVPWFICVSIVFALPRISWPQSGDEHDKQTQVQELSKAPDRLEGIDKSVTHLEAEIVIMVAVVTLVLAVLLGTAIYGEYRLILAIREIERKRKEVLDRFPKLAAMEKQAREVLKELEGKFSDDDWLADRYASFEIPDRQQILTAEHLIALEFAGPVTAPQLRGMANFYSSKYKSERVKADLDRALYYALRAAERGQDRFQYLNDLGLLYTDLSQTEPKYLKSALNSMDTSKRKQPAQQRCYYNLSIIYFGQALEARREGQTVISRALLEQTRELLKTALSFPKWELEESPASTSLIHYNLSCCLCRLAESDMNAESQNLLLDEAATYLNLASNFKQTKRKTLQDDLTGEEGDLFLLASNPYYAQRLQKIVENFERSWGA